MLYSPSQGVALARHPKTASTSLSAWFEGEFPDTVAADAIDVHVRVLPALRTLRLIKEPRPSSWRRRLEKARLCRPREPRLSNDVRVIIGVIREPFEMLVSLYSYWRRRSTVVPRRPGTLPHTAATASFRDFVVQAAIERRLPSYDEFFGVGSEAWSVTKLIDFRHLSTGLEAVCREFNVAPLVAVPSINLSPQNHDLAAYRDEVKFLLPAIRSRYRWYYEEAEKIMIRGEAASATSRAAA